MVAARWRLQRVAIIETQLYAEYMERAEDNSDHPLSPIESLTSAFTGLANSNSYPFLDRVAARLERAYSRALRTLIQLQRPRQSSKTPSAEICTNEPTGPTPTNAYSAGPNAITPDATTRDAPAPDHPSRGLLGCRQTQHLLMGQPPDARRGFGTGAEVNRLGKPIAGAQ